MKIILCENLKANRLSEITQSNVKVDEDPFSISNVPKPIKIDTLGNQKIKIEKREMNYYSEKLKIKSNQR